MLISDIANRLGLSTSYLETLAATASYRYKKYKIKKRTGGERQIHHPARELKLIQNWLLTNVLSKLPVHDAATAYRPGSSIYQNASLHVRNNYLLRIDFQDFFPSLTGADVAAVLAAASHSGRINSLSGSDIHFVTATVCCKGSLVIGAPSSPALCNAIMYEFDAFWFERCRKLQVTYTRYADDLYFSTNIPNVLSDLLVSIQAYLSKQLFPKLRINKAKTVFTSRKRLRRVTGLVLTSDRKISIGRKQKRILKSLVFGLVNGKLDAPQRSKLRGWISYLRSVEPSFVNS